MPKHACSQAKCSWSAEISMMPAKHLKESLFFTMILPSRLAHWTKLRWHIGKRAKPRKQTGYRGNYTSATRITPAGECSAHEEFRSSGVRYDPNFLQQSGGLLESQSLCYTRAEIYWRTEEWRIPQLYLRL